MKAHTRLRRIERALQSRPDGITWEHVDRLLALVTGAEWQRVTCLQTGSAISDEVARFEPEDRRQIEPGEYLKGILSFFPDGFVTELEERLALSPDPFSAADVGERFARVHISAREIDDARREKGQLLVSVALDSPGIQWGTWRPRPRAEIEAALAEIRKRLEADGHSSAVVTFAAMTDNSRTLMRKLKGDLMSPTA